MNVGKQFKTMYARIKTAYKDMLFNHKHIVKNSVNFISVGNSCTVCHPNNGGCGVIMFS